MSKKRGRRRAAEVSRRCVIVLSAACAFAGEFEPAIGAVTWDNGAHNELWSNATNWNPNALPVATDDVIFPSPLPSMASSVIGLPIGAVAKSLTFNSEVSLYN